MATKLTPALLVLTTVAKKSDAAHLATTLVEEKLAACVTILPAGESRYVWQGKLCVEKEFVLLIKTLAYGYAKLERRLRAIHPYECPEIVALPVARGAAAYLKWLAGGVA
ncbi:MAG: divalent-cation tolerance protein CutA [Deltaproteobacteria bacterium]|nr:divalent-cation tolerance protein CutA [Deltaproteobacteria bacterium]